MNFQTPRFEIVRWGALGLMLGIAACGGDSVTAPQADGDMVVTPSFAKQGSRGNTNDECNATDVGTCVAYGEDSRLRQWRWFPEEGVIRECSVNALERNQIPARYSPTGIQHVVNEFDAVVMVREAESTTGQVVNPDGGLNFPDPWKVTHIGVARWNASLWWLRDSSSEDGYGAASTWTSRTMGIVAPWPGVDGQEIGQGNVWDALDEIFAIQDNAPNDAGSDLDKVDLTEGATFYPTLVDYLESVAESDPLQGLDCRVEAWLSSGWAPVNIIDVSDRAPRGLYRLLDG